MNASRIRAVAASALIATMGPVSPSMAIESLGNSSNVNLIATLDSGPAMHEVNWTIYRVVNNHLTRYTTRRTHSMSLPLEPGRYKAVANLNDVSRDRTFNVDGRTSVDVVIAMDK